MKKEIHLFIIWEKARIHTATVLEKIKSDFNILEMYEITWNLDNFEKNLKKFYGITLSSPLRKINQVGKGSFLLVLVCDESPKYQRRKTSMGKQIVNENMFRKKRELRELIQGEFPIHGTIHEKETKHNLALLLGKDLGEISKGDEIWSGEIQKIHRDVSGIPNWKNFKQLFFVLNNTTNYVILRNHDQILKNEINEEKEDIDMLTDDQFQVPYIVGKKQSDDIHKDYPFVNINGKFIKVDLKYVGDVYLDEKWSKEILLNRKLDSHLIYIPSDEDYFYSLIHHIIVQNVPIKEKYEKTLLELNKELQIDEFQNKLFDRKYLKKILDEFMNNKGYKYTKSFNYKIFHNESLRLIKVAIKIARADGMNEVIRASKGKIKRKIKW